MSKISEKVLGDIKEKKVKPTCKLYFVAREIMYWSFYMLVMLLSSFVVAGILEMLFGREFEIASWDMILKKIFIEIPMYWFLILILFLFAGLYIGRRTKRAYRYKKRIILIGEMLVVSLFGIILYFLEAGIFTCDILGR